MFDQIDIQAQQANFSRYVEIAFFDKKTSSVAAPLVFSPISEAEIIKPAITIHPNAAQNLMDDLWRMGIRPSNGTGNAGQLAATQEHLNDMRQIAFKKLGMEAK